MAQPKTETEFYTEKWKKSDSMKARFKVTRSFSDFSTGAATVRVMDIKTQNPARLIRYANIFKGIKHGLELHYYPEGALKLRAFYQNGVLVDTLRTYYPDQRLKRVEAYQKGKLLDSSCFGLQDEPLKCDPLLIQPEPEGGAAGIRSLLHTVEYPVQARQAGIQGDVSVSFLVLLDGTLSDFVIEQAADPLLNYAVLDAFKRSKVRWKPGTVDGEPVEMRITCPVSFKM